MWCPRSCRGSLILADRRRTLGVGKQHVTPRPTTGDVCTKLHLRAIGRMEKAIERQGVPTEQRMKDLVAALAEAIYPKISADHDDIPIRNFFFDGTQSDLDRDVGIFMELACTYQARKKRPRP